MAAALSTLVGCDHATKYVAKAELENQPPREMIGSFLDLRYVENTDIAFNLLRWIPEGVRGPMLIGLGAVAVFTLVAVLWRFRGGAGTKAAFVFILAGALGNYLDRILRGYVVDFIHVPHWPVFNFADVWVTVGVALWMLANFKRRRSRDLA